MRSLSLHVSALNNAEYDLFIPSLLDLAGANDLHDVAGSASTSDAFYEGLSLGVREVRAWLRGRYSDISGPSIDTILKLFCPKLSQEDTLSAGQFFAAFRLVLHVRQGQEVDKGLAFVQVHPAESKQEGKPTPPSTAPPSLPPSPPKRQTNNPHPPPPSHPSSRPNSPSKRRSLSNRVQSPPPPIRNPAPPDVPPKTNPFHQHRLSQPDPSDSISTTDSNISSPPVIPIPSSQFPASSFNPFRSSTTAAANVGSKQKGPPLPPRKPSLRASSPPPVIPPPSSSFPSSSNKPPRPPPLKAPSAHATSPIMLQALQASRSARDAKKAEEERERTRVLHVLKTSSSSANVRSKGYSSATSSASDNSVDSSSTDAIKTKNSLWLPGRSLVRDDDISDAVSNLSIEEVANADAKAGKQPFTLSSPPPTHPDRRPSVSATSVSSSLGSDEPSRRPPPTPSSAHVTRSRSLHHHPAPPPPPPPRRKRPESEQLAPSPTRSSSFSTASSTTNSPRKQPPPPMSAGLSRHHTISSVSLSSDRKSIATTNSTSTPMDHIQKTLEALQPKLQTVRYKAEAGLTRRGFIAHHGRHPSGLWSGAEGEGEEGLMKQDHEYAYRHRLYDDDDDGRGDYERLDSNNNINDDDDCSTPSGGGGGVSPFLPLSSRRPHLQQQQQQQQPLVMHGPSPFDDGGGVLDDDADVDNDSIGHDGDYFNARRNVFLEKPLKPIDKTRVPAATATAAPLPRWPQSATVRGSSWM